MRIARVAAATDPGRRRRRNEDSFVIEPPLFAVADGMGGAQAGEVASKLAAGALKEGGAPSPRPSPSPGRRMKLSCGRRTSRAALRTIRQMKT